MPCVDERCKDCDKQNKLLAAEYRQTTGALKRCIDNCVCSLNINEDNCLSHCRKWLYLHPLDRRLHIDRCRKRTQIIPMSPTEIKERIKILNEMYRTTSAIGREAEHYYEQDWWRSEIYTLNTRKRG